MASFFGEGIDNAIVEMIHQKCQYWMDQRVSLLKQLDQLELKIKKELRKIYKGKKKIEVKEGRKIYFYRTFK